MIKLLIVDDEVWIRERLRDTIDWDVMGVQVIGEACDGEEALELAEELYPDIIITDIRMPCINGLELSKRLKENQNKAKVIIISGYSDFEYAQKAIQFGAFDYILKPIEDDRLMDTVQKCMDQIAEDNRMDDLIQEANRQMKESKTLLKDKFYHNVISDYFRKEEDIIKELEFLEISHDSINKICFVIQVDENQDKDSALWDKHLLNFLISNIAKDFIDKIGEGDTLFLQTGEVICLVFSKKDEEKLTRQVLSISQGIRTMIKKITGYTVTIGVGRVRKTFMELSDSYHEANEALHYKFYLGCNKIYDIRSIQIEHKPSYYKIKDMEILLNHIKMGDSSKALTSLKNMFEEILKEECDITPVNLKFIYIDIINSVFKTVLESNNAIDDFSNFSMEFFQQLNRLQTVDEIYQWLSETIMKIIDLHNTFKKSKRRKIIDMAVDYIHDHYKEALTLNCVAEKLYFNSSYFCKIFKEETGKSFTKYLIQYRMQKAKELLGDSTLKVYEVGERVGYDDSRYFAKIFKATQGVTPIQYREKIQ